MSIDDLNRAAGGVAPELEDEAVVVLSDKGIGGLLDAAYPESKERTESLIARLTGLARQFEGRAIELVLRPERPVEQMTPLEVVHRSFDEWPYPDEDPPDPL
jgi:hypothetical protein